MTAVEVIWRPQAREDLLDLYVYIARDNPTAAEQLDERMQRKVMVLSAHPRLGTSRPDIPPSTRILVEGPYLILFEIHPDTELDRSRRSRSSALSTAGAT
ncbi:MAG: type II toxin-antitoxin system RelE/ParE family toxin [Stellaceae bacterium]